MIRRPPDRARANISPLDTDTPSVSGEMAVGPGVGAAVGSGRGHWCWRVRGCWGGHGRGLLLLDRYQREGRESSRLTGEGCGTLVAVPAGDLPALDVGDERAALVSHLDDLDALALANAGGVPLAADLETHQVVPQRRVLQIDPG